MKKVIFILAMLSIVLVSCGQKQKGKSVDGVQYAGSLMEVMNGKIDAVITLNELKSIPNLYGLGPVEGLKGEIQIFNSRPVVSNVIPKGLSTHSNFQDKAAMLVYAQVPEWQEIQVPKAILTKKQFEEYIEYTAVKAGLDINEPFPFLLEGHIRKINWHIIDWDPNRNDHSPQTHRNSGLNGVVVEERVEIIGFYSTKHKGVFTHHDSNVHMHFNCTDIELAGHLDDILLGEYMTLKLPK